MVNRERKLYKRAGSSRDARYKISFLFLPTSLRFLHGHGGNRYAKSVTGCHNSHHRRANRSRTPSQSRDERLGTGPNSSPSVRGICCVSFRSFPPSPLCGDSSPNLEKRRFCVSPFSYVGFAAFEERFRNGLKKRARDGWHTRKVYVCVTWIR